jgi:hypothetical protein
MEKLNQMQISAVGIPNAEVFGRDDQEQSKFDRIVVKDIRERAYLGMMDAIVSDNVGYEEAYGAAKKVAENELVKLDNLQKSKQAVIAAKLMRIRAEIKQLEQQLS